MVPTISAKFFSATLSDRYSVGSCSAAAMMMLRAARGGRRWGVDSVAAVTGAAIARAGRTAAVAGRVAAAAFIAAVTAGFAMAV